MLEVRETKNTANQTKPPPRFTQGTLLKAMQHVDRLVVDPAEKKKLKAVEGIGRSATRAAIIETLLKRSFLVTQSKHLISSPIGRYVVGILPKDLTDPGLTARWETILDAIASGSVQLSVFEQRQQMWVKQLVAQAIAAPLPTLPEDTAPAATAKRASGGSSGTSRSGSSKSSSGTRKSSASGKAPAAVSYTHL